MKSSMCFLYESFLPFVHFEHFALTSYILHLFFVIMGIRIFRMIVITENSWHYSSGHYFGFPLRTCLWCPPQNIYKKKSLLKIFLWPSRVNPFQWPSEGVKYRPPSPSPGHVVFQPMHAMHNPIFIFVAKPIFPLIVVVKQLEYFVILWQS